ncbi:MAG: ion channel [Candidatus Oleimicrobiaceae bacterium]
MVVDPHTRHSLLRMERSIDSLFYFLYLSVMTATTVDYGDILSPRAGVKVVVMSQKVLCYLTLWTLIGLIVSWAAGNVDKEAGERRRR